uniref:Uncharacterized protein n=1 Tax=Meloidogyne javanica TaxID=6303 RepID=A0A915LTZ1_MELJA
MEANRYKTEPPLTPVKGSTSIACFDPFELANKWDFEAINSTKGHHNMGIGNRIATVLLYLSTPEKGGFTIFNQIKTIAKPTKHDALFWHAACPVLLGDKWVSNSWIHERGQEFIRPCGLDPSIQERYVGDLGVPVRDFCYENECSATDAKLSKPAFEKLENLSVGSVQNAKLTFVNCDGVLYPWMELNEPFTGSISFYANNRYGFCVVDPTDAENDLLVAVSRTLFDKGIFPSKDPLCHVCLKVDYKGKW